MKSHVEKGFGDEGGSVTPGAPQTSPSQPRVNEPPAEGEKNATRPDPTPANPDTKDSK